MFRIQKGTIKDAEILSKISKKSFLVAHGHSAHKKDIDSYTAKNFSKDNFTKELVNKENLYFLIYSKNKIAGYSKIIINKTNANISAKNITLMSRLYLLKEFFGLNLGKELFNFNLNLSKENNQQGIWLAVWIENKRAINFYHKMGFQKVGSFDFEISKTHYNPNHILYLEF